MLKHSAEHKVLGIHWNTALDQLVFSLDAILEESVVVGPTKRVVISLIGRVYDLLGFLSPVTVFQYSYAGAVQEQAGVGSAVEWGVANQVDKTN